MSEARAKPLVVAHRGDSATHPGNTWAALASAVNGGADALEVDLQLCRDGTIVLYHDYHVDGRAISDLSFDDFSRLRPDHPTLHDLLGWEETSHVLLLLEAKDPALLHPLATMLSRHPEPEHVLVGSFHGPFLRDFASVCPRIKTSLMLGTVLDITDMARLGQSYRCHMLHPCWEERAPRPHLLLSASDVERLRHEGFELIIWHEERPAELKALLALSPFAICTNTPAILRRMRDADPN